MVRRLLGGGLALIAILLTATPAMAHARLVSSIPSGGSTLSEAPSKITLEFSERIETSFGGVQVFDPSGTRLEAGEPRITGSGVILDLNRLPGPGTYTVVFRIISGDGHPVESRFAFNYQPAPEAAPGLEPGGASPEPQVSGVAAPLDVKLEAAGPGTAAGLWSSRLLNYLTLTALVGLLLLAGILLADGPRLSDQQRQVARAAGLAGLALALSCVLLFLFGLSNAAARSLPHAIGGDLPTRFAATRFGRVTLVQGIVALAVGGIALVSASTKRRAVVLLALGGAALAAMAPGWWGHAGTATPRAVALISDWGHVLGVTAWVGGLAALCLLILRPKTASEIAGPSRRFSRLAGWAFVLVLGTGIVNAVVHIDAPGQLASTGWGRLVVLKLILLAVVGLLGWRNRTRMLPRLDGETPAGPQAFRRLAAAEVAIMVLAIAVATTLASTIPADAEAASRIQSIATAFGQGQINLTVDPAEQGENVVHLYFFDSNGRQLEVEQPSLTLTQGFARVEVRLFKAGPGHYTALGQRIDRQGSYQVAVTATVGGRSTTSTGTIQIQ